MSNDPISPPPGPAEPARRKRFGRLPRAAVAGGIATGLALGGAGIAFAASTSPTTTPGKSPGTPKKPAHHSHSHAFRSGAGAPILGLNRVIHGQFTVPVGSGFRTVNLQIGTASAVSSSSMVVTSADHYQSKYTVTSSTMIDSQREGIGSIANGDNVRVLSTSVGGVNTAVSISDNTKLGASGKAFGFGAAPDSGPGPGAFGGWKGTTG